MPKGPKLAGAGIALVGLMWGLMFCVAILVAGSLQLSIESDAATYQEFSSGDCSGAPILSLEFGKGASSQQIANPAGGNSKPLFVLGSCGLVTQAASIQVCSDAACSQVVSSLGDQLFQNCSSPGIVYGGKSAQINCVNKQQSLQDGVGLFATIVVGLFSFVAIFLLADLGEELKQRFPLLDCSAKNDEDDPSAAGLAGGIGSVNGDGSDAAGSGYQLVRGSGSGGKVDEEA